MIALGIYGVIILYLVIEVRAAIDDPIDDAFDQLAEGDCFPVAPFIDQPRGD